MTQTSSMTVEDYMKELVRPKLSHTIIVSGKDSRLHTVFNPPLNLASCQHEMALLQLDTYYSFPNIGPLNNSVKLSVDNGVTWKIVSIPTGCYEIEGINSELQRLIVKEIAGGKAGKVVLSPNNNTLRCILDIKDVNYRVDFAIENSLRTVLGFEGKIYNHGRWESENLVDIMNVNTIMVHCDVIGATRVNGVEAPVIYTFFPNASPGDKIVSLPRHLTYVPITLDIISHLTCWLTDQDGRELNLRGETLTITFYIKAC